MLRSLLQLALAGSAVLLLTSTSATAQLLGMPEPFEQFGTVVAAGDFNGDGYADLAVGVPQEIVEGNEAGGVHVIYGSNGGLAVSSNALLLQGFGGVLDLSEDGDHFGGAVAAGDFNGDGFDDLAIGVSGEDTPTIVDAGAVHVLYGSADGLQTASSQLWTQPDWGSFDETSDRLGRALATGDFDGDGFDDLAMGVPNEDDGATVDAGIVHILYGTAAGLDAARHQAWWQDDTGTGANDPSDQFGTALSVGDFDGDGFKDLAIGILQEDAATAFAAGGVAVLYGMGSGLSSNGSQLWIQGEAGLPGNAEEGDFFGSSLASGDLDGDGFDDLAIGALFEDIGPITHAGNVTHLYGTASGLSATGSGSFSSPAVGLPLEGGEFGRSLTSGDFDGDGFNDLGVGAPNMSVPGIPSTGRIAVIPGSTSGLDVSEAVVFSQEDAGVEGTAEPSENFGRALAAGDFDGDGNADIAVGVPFDGETGIQEAGGVNVLYGVFGGLDSSQLWYQGANPVANEPTAPGLPSSFALFPAYPNPFNPSTTLRYDVPEAGPVRLVVFDALGRKVAVLVDDEHTPGHHAITFEADGLPSGVYLVRLVAGHSVRTRQVALVR